MGDPVYTTREVVKSALESRGGASTDAQIDRLIATWSRNIERETHRKFWPWQGTNAFDWPGTGLNRFSPSWVLELGDRGLIELTAFTANGSPLNLADINLEPANDGPPFTRIELNRGSSAAFSAGSTPQRALTGTGLWGWDLVEDQVATLSGTVGDANLVLEVTDSSGIGHGSLIRIGDERMNVTRIGLTETGVTLTSALTDRANDQVVYTTGGPAAPNPGEVIAVESERMLVTDRVGSAVFVRRAVDGSTIAPHDTSAAVYARRALTVERGAAGTTATEHLATDPVLAWQPFPPIHTWATEEVIAAVLQEGSGMSRTVGSADAERESNLRGLLDARATGRKYRRRTRNLAV